MTLWSLLGACLLAACTSGAQAAEKRHDAAQVAAESWLKVIDEGKYAMSWAQAARLFRDNLSRSQWQQMVNRMRAPLGVFVSRKLKSREYAEGKMRGAPDGQYVVLKYETVFRGKPAAIELVVSMVDIDGAWRVSAYGSRSADAEADCRKGLAKTQDCSP